MYFSPSERALGDIVKKVENGERLSKNDGIRLLESYDLLSIGYMANIVHVRKKAENVCLDCKDDSLLEINTNEDLIDHLIHVREQQDISGAFQAFNPISLDFQTRTTGFEDLKMLAVSRLMLDNFPHIKTLSITLGPKLAQIALSFGVDSVDGTSDTGQAQEGF